MQKYIVRTEIEKIRQGYGTTVQFIISFEAVIHLLQNALNNSMRIEYVSKLLNHSDIGITQIYAKVISEELRIRRWNNTSTNYQNW